MSKENQIKIIDLQIADEDAEHIVTVNDVITYIKNNKLFQFVA